MPLPQEDKRYTYADYCTWDDSERWELIDGVPYAMSPAPNHQHQRITRRLVRRFEDFLEGKSCELFNAPSDVRLAADGDDDTVVQPDLFVVCDKSKLDGQNCNGAPDLVIEILSPSSAVRDTVDKFKLYRRVGVREYWIVDPKIKTVHVYVLKNDSYYVDSYEENEDISSSVLDGLTISLPDVFAE